MTETYFPSAKAAELIHNPHFLPGWALGNGTHKTPQQLITTLTWGKAQSRDYHSLALVNQLTAAHVLILRKHGHNIC